MDKRYNTIDRMRARTMSSEEFDFDRLSAPPLLSLLTPQDLQGISNCILHAKSDDPMLREKEVNKILNPKGFYRLGAGTNRTCYECNYNPNIVLKVALTRLLFTDNPREFKNQQIFKPFVTKCFEVSADGCVGLFERVVPITSREEFTSVAPEIKALLDNWFVGKYVFTDIGTHYFMNWGVRKGFGPVLLDYPYCYELDESKLFCDRPQRDSNGKIVGLCGGIIDYDPGYNFLYCTKCGRKFRAREIGKPESLLEHFFDDDGDHNMYMSGGSNKHSIYVARGGKVIKSTDPDIIIGTEVSEMMKNAELELKRKHDEKEKKMNNVFDEYYGLPQYVGYKLQHPKVEKAEDGSMKDKYGNIYDASGKTMTTKVADPFEEYFRKHPQLRPASGDYSVPMMSAKIEEVNNNLPKVAQNYEDKVREDLSNEDRNSINGRFDILEDKINQFTDAFIERNAYREAAPVQELNTGTHTVDEMYNATVNLTNVMTEFIHNITTITKVMSDKIDKLSDVVDNITSKEETVKAIPEEKKKGLDTNSPIFFEKDVNPMDRIKDLEAQNDELSAELRQMKKAQAFESDSAEPEENKERTNVDALNEQIEKLTKENDDLAKENDGMKSDYSDKISKLSAEINELKKENVTLGKKVGKANDNDKEIDNLNKQINVINGQLSNSRKSYASLSKSKSDIDEQNKSLKKELKDANDKIKDLNSIPHVSESAVGDDNARLNTELATLQEEYDKACADLNAKETENTEYKKQVTDLTTLKNALEERLKLSDETAEAKETKELVTFNSKIYDKANFKKAIGTKAEKGDSGTKLLVLVDDNGDYVKVNGKIVCIESIKDNPVAKINFTVIDNSSKKEE